MAILESTLWCIYILYDFFFNLINSFGVFFLYIYLGVFSVFLQKVGLVVLVSDQFSRNFETFTMS